MRSALFSPAGALCGLLALPLLLSGCPQTPSEIPDRPDGADASEPVPAEPVPADPGANEGGADDGAPSEPATTEPTPGEPAAGERPPGEGDSGIRITERETDVPCSTDGDCVPNDCCHSTTCVAKVDAPGDKCKEAMCTMDCRAGTTDCGGGCLCRSGKCVVQLFGLTEMKPGSGG